MDQAAGPGSSGNTRTEEPHKHRNWFVTFWVETYPNELPSNATYLCTCDDTTKEGKKHGHAFIYFKNQVTMRAVKKLFGNDCHCEQPFKNSDCINYVLDKSKRKFNFHEYGIKPMDNGLKRTVAELAEVKDPANLDWKQYSAWEKIHAKTANDVDIEDWKKDVKVYWIWGPSGIGKTEKAKQIVRENKEVYGTKVNIVKYENSFWSGIGTAEIAIYDDFRDSHMKPSEFINFIDYNTHDLNVKGGHERNNYKLIIITSVQNPQVIYANVDGEPRKQWLRRMEIIHLFETVDFDIEDI